MENLHLRILIQRLPYLVSLDAISSFFLYYRSNKFERKILLEPYNSAKFRFSPTYPWRVLRNLAEWNGGTIKFERANDSPLIGVARRENGIRKSLLPSIGRGTPPLELGPSFAETPINDRSNDHASDSSSIHDREGIESRWKCEPRSAVPSHGRDVSRFTWHDQRVFAWTRRDVNYSPWCMRY